MNTFFKISIVWILIISKNIYTQTPDYELPFLYRYILPGYEEILKKEEKKFTNENQEKIQNLQSQIENINKSIIGDEKKQTTQKQYDFFSFDFLKDKTFINLIILLAIFIIFIFINKSRRTF